jgi:peptidoglycan/LPS O-acetylase OafA/YrhL
MGPPDYSSTSAFERSRSMVLLGTYSASASLALAYLSYELLEKRFLRLKRAFETAKETALQRLAAGGVAGP